MRIILNLEKITRQIIIVIFWFLWLLFAGTEIFRYFRISKKFLANPERIVWQIYHFSNQKINIVFADEGTENNLKKYLPALSRPGKPIRKGKFLFLNGTNGWHHLTKKFIDDFYADQRFTLILIDAHSDAAPLSKNEKINCGNWINFIQQPVIFLGGSAGFDDEFNRFTDIQLITRKKLRMYPARHFSFYLKSRQKLPENNFCRTGEDRLASFLGAPGYYLRTYSLNDFYQSPVVAERIYISIDLDVLGARFIHTDYGSGLLTLEELRKLLDFLFAKNEVVGIDLCGLAANADEKSRQTWQRLLAHIWRHLNF